MVVCADSGRVAIIRSVVMMIFFIVTCFKYKYVSPSPWEREGERLPILSKLSNILQVK